MNITVAEVPAAVVPDSAPTAAARHAARKKAARLAYLVHLVGAGERARGDDASSSDFD